MKTILAAVAIFYGIGVVGTFWLHTQMPVTLGLALLRSALWPWWMLGGLHGSLLPMD
jgi:hypothetical protein